MVGGQDFDLQAVTELGRGQAGGRDAQLPADIAIGARLVV